VQEECGHEVERLLRRPFAQLGVLPGDARRDPGALGVLGVFGVERDPGDVDCGDGPVV
jgi:hypothetical protein